MPKSKHAYRDRLAPPRPFGAGISEGDYWWPTLANRDAATLAACRLIPYRCRDRNAAERASEIRRSPRLRGESVASTGRAAIASSADPARATAQLPDLPHFCRWPIQPRPA